MQKDSVVTECKQDFLWSFWFIALQLWLRQEIEGCVFPRCPSAPGCDLETWMDSVQRLPVLVPYMPRASKLHHSDDSSVKWFVDNDPLNQKQLLESFYFRQRDIVCSAPRYTHTDTHQAFPPSPEAVLWRLPYSHESGRRAEENQRANKIWGVLSCSVWPSKTLWVQEANGANQQKWMTRRREELLRFTRHGSLYGFYFLTPTYQADSEITTLALSVEALAH